MTMSEGPFDLSRNPPVVSRRVPCHPHSSKSVALNPFRASALIFVVLLLPRNLCETIKAV